MNNTTQKNERRQRDEIIDILEEAWASCYKNGNEYAESLIADAQVLVNAALSRPSAIRAQAMEEAAKVCDSVNNYDNPMTASDCADAIRSLASQPVQDGYVLVPVEPTEEMCFAAIDVLLTDWWEGKANNGMKVMQIRECSAHDIYKAMISAAPTAAQRKGEEK